MPKKKKTKQPSKLHKYELDPEEKEILAAFEAGTLVPVKNQEAWKRRLKAAAYNTLRKNKNINIRVSQRDLDQLKARALEEGLPYQTIVGALIRRFNSGKIKLFSS